MKSKNYVKVHKYTCVACGSCEGVCQKQAIRVIDGCFAEVNEEICIGCGKCAKICPVGCIEILAREARA